MYVSVGNYMCKLQQSGELCISLVTRINTQRVSMSVLLCTVYKTFL